MARKSNKTAHVLNLLAGHDAAKEADEQASIEQATSGGPAAQTASGGAAVQAAQNDAASGGVSQESSDEEAPQAVSGSEPPHAAPGSAASQRASGRQAVGQTKSAGASDSANAGQSVAPVPIPVMPAQNNIAVIDKTEEDPVAELIQQKLSSEFEKQMQQSQEEISPVGDVKPAQEAAAVSAEASADHPDSLPLADAEEIIEDIHMEELLLSDAESMVPEQGHAPAVTEANAGAIILDEDTAEAFDDLSVEDSFPIQEDESLTILEAEPIAEEDLTIEPAAAVPAPAPEPESQAEPEPKLQAEPEPELQTEPEPELTEEPEPELQAEPEPELQAEQAESVSELQTEPESDFAAINVMEHIVRDKIIYFMRQFDVCTCDRCKADVTALTLNGLMPKYIVTMKAAVDPLLSYYTNRLISDVTVEATKSCMIVKENPRH